MFPKNTAKIFLNRGISKLTLPEARAQASELFPEFNFPEVITPEGLVKIYSDSAICLREGEFFKVYINDVLYGESELSPVAAWHDACLNLPEQFLDFFYPEFSETGNYYTKEDIKP